MSSQNYQLKDNQEKLTAYYKKCIDSLDEHEQNYFFQQVKILGEIKSELTKKIEFISEIKKSISNEQRSFRSWVWKNLIVVAVFTTVEEFFLEIQLKNFLLFYLSFSTYFIFLTSLYQSEIGERKVKLAVAEGSLDAIYFEGKKIGLYSWHFEQLISLSNAIDKKTDLDEKAAAYAEQKIYHTKCLLIILRHCFDANTVFKNHEFVDEFESLIHL